MSINTLTFNQCDQLLSALTKVCEILNPDNDRLLDLSLRGEEEAIHMEIVRIEVFNRLVVLNKQNKDSISNSL